MKRGNCSCRVAMFCLVAIHVDGQGRPLPHEPNLHEEPDVARVERSIPFTKEFAGQPIPRYRNGHVVTYDATKSRALVWDSSGKSVMDRQLELPGASRVSITGLAVAPDGSVVAAASVTDASQRGSVIAWMESSGTVRQVVVTSPFVARHLAFALDGSLWALGRVHDNQFDDEADYPVLRRYDSRGRLAQTALPRSSFAAGRIGPTQDSLFAVSKHRLAVVSLTAREWVEVAHSGEVVARWALSVDPSDILTGVGLTDQGDLFASIQRNEYGRLYRYHRDSQTLEQVDTRQVHSAAQGFYLLGSEGDKLVCRIKPAGSLLWIRVDKTRVAEASRVP